MSSKPTGTLGGGDTNELRPRPSAMRTRTITGESAASIPASEGGTDVEEEIEDVSTIATTPIRESVSARQALSFDPMDEESSDNDDGESHKGVAPRVASSPLKSGTSLQQPSREASGVQFTKSSNTLQVPAGGASGTATKKMTSWVSNTLRKIKDKVAPAPPPQPPTALPNSLEQQVRHVLVALNRISTLLIVAPMCKSDTS